MRNLTISITIKYSHNRYTLNPTATVTASLAGVRTDTTKGTARGGGYDKPSAAVCYAFDENPLLQTLLLWGGWNTGTEAYGPDVVRDHEWSFDGQGVSTLLSHLRANGFTVDAEDDRKGRPARIFASRNMPASFVALV